MSSVLFGELIALAREDLAAAGRNDADLGGASMVEAARAAGRIAWALSRYLGDVAPYGVVETVVNPSLDDRVRAVVDARQALRAAAATLRLAAEPGAAGRAAPDAGPAHQAGESSPSAVDPHAGPAVARLRAAGAALVAGRDLLRTHLGSGAGGEWVDRSQWAPVIRSAPVARAVLSEVARWSGELAFLAARLSLAAPADGPAPTTVRHALVSSCHWFLTASTALTAAQHADPVSPADVRLLEAIPANHIPVRRPPVEGEPVAVLAEGVADSAARLAAITRIAPGWAVWSPAMTADSWRWTAGAAVAICHMSQRALQLLAGHPELGTWRPGVGAELTAAAERIGRAWERWRDVARAWQSITTETKGLTGPGLSDTSDLALRLGRIIFHDPGWTPERRDSAASPSAAGLAPEPDGFATVVGAVHHAIDALARIAAADREAVGLAIRASRLHVPTRSLPGWRNVPYRLGPAMPATTAALRDAYENACEMTASAVPSMDALAVAVDAPSRVLADARASARPPASGVRFPGETAQLDGVTTRGTSHELPLSADRPRGPVEEAVRALNPADPSILLRAQAVDRAANEVIRQAQGASAAGRVTTGLNAEPQTAGQVSAEVAGRSFPQSSPAKALAPGQPGAAVTVRSSHVGSSLAPGVARSQRQASI